ncbi:MAG: hypothetical protein GJ680_11430 [Alteromonadaceae bacterium]|nr:hypothetical protein [Alteromonadaceae bacterium]
MDKETASTNRFVRYQQEGKKVKLYGLVFLVLFVILFSIEVILAVAFTTRSYFQERNSQQLFERYYILMPFKAMFDMQSHLPKAWQELYIGSSDTLLDTVLAYLPDPLLDHRLRPDISWAPIAGATTTTNAQGFATTYEDRRVFKHTPEQDTFRILFLGGSTVEGWGAKNSMFSLPSIFKTEIEKRFLPIGKDKIRFEVMNAGVSDYDSTTEYLYYANELLHYQPHLVISYNGGNDSMDLHSQHEEAPHLLESVSYSMNKEILLDSYSVMRLLLRALKITAQEMVFSMKRLFVTDIFFKIATFIDYKLSKNHLEYPFNHSAANSALQVYTKNMIRLKRELETTSTHFAWFTQPNLAITDYQPQDDLIITLKKGFEEQVKPISKFYSETEKVMQSLTKTQGVDSIFCAQNISDTLNNSKSEVYLDQVHLNEAGNRKVVERILSELVSCGLIHIKK